MSSLSQDRRKTIESQGLILDINPDSVLLSLKDGCELNKSLLVSVLKEAGITKGLDKNALGKALTLSKQGQAVVNLVIAHAQTEEKNQLKQIDTGPSTDCIVVPGDIIKPSVLALLSKTNSKSQANTEQSESTKPSLSAGTNTRLKQKKLFATSYGVVVLKENTVEVSSTLDVSDNKLEARLDIYQSTSSGEHVTLQHIQALLEKEKIIFGIQTENIEKALALAKSANTPQKRVLVAIGQVSKAATAGSYQFFFTIDQKDPLDMLKKGVGLTSIDHVTALDLVEEGRELCREIPPKPEKVGRDIYDQLMKPPALEKKSLDKINCGENVVFAGDTFKCEAPKFGYAILDGNTLRVESPIKISKDTMQASLHLYPSNFRSDLVTKENILTLVKLLGIEYGLIDSAIELALEKVNTAKANQQLEKVVEVIAEGQQEKTGTDASFDYFVSVDKQAGESKDDGTIDFHERGTIINIKNGDAIGKKNAATPGLPRINVLGETSPAKGGKDIQFEAGQNCELREDGIFYATDDGALLIKDGIVHITDIFSHSGNVDLHTGNLHHKKGAIEISGSVLSGFEVKANGHILVKENVDNGKIVAGGDVVVNQGVIQPEKSIGYIHAMGSVTTKFAQNAKILSYKDIIVEGSAMNCQFNAKGKVEILKGKGCIIGGSVKACELIHVKQVGSEAGSLTLVEIELDPKRQKELSDEITNEKTLIMMKQGDSLKLARLIQEQKQLIDQALEKAAIIVEGTLYPGVTVKILGVAQLVKEPIQRCKVTLTPNNKLYFGSINCSSSDLI